jgi:hypothetical protein
MQEVNNISIISLISKIVTVILLWVDNKLSGDNATMQKMLEKQVPKLKIVTIISTAELLTWLNKFGADTVHKLRIVTNRYRELDGKEKAAGNHT